MAIQLWKDGQWLVGMVGLIIVVIPSSCHTPLAFCHVHADGCSIYCLPALSVSTHSTSVVNSIVPTNILYLTQLLPFEHARWQRCVHVCCMQLWQRVHSVCWTSAFVFATGNVLHLWVSSAMSLLWDRLEGWLGTIYLLLSTSWTWMGYSVGIVNTKSAENRS